MSASGNEKDITLRDELIKYDKQGIPLLLNGCPSNMDKILHAHLIEEEGNYMRDYQHDERGNLKSVCFDKITDV